MAASATVFAHGAIEFREAYEVAGEMENVLNNLRYVSEYFVRTYPQENVYFGQVGDGDVDHSLMTRPEQFNDMCRPAWKCTATSPCTEPAADSASALAAASILFEQHGDSSFANSLFKKAKQIAQYRIKKT